MKLPLVRGVLGGWLLAMAVCAFGQESQPRTLPPVEVVPPAQGIAGLRWRDECNTSYFDVYTWLVYRQDRYNPTNFTDSRFWVNGSPVTPGYGTLNLRCGTSLGECDQHRVSLVLENITNQYYRVLGSGVDGTGFNAILGYEWLR